MLLANDVFNLDVSFLFSFSCLCVCMCVCVDPNIDTSNTLEIMANVMHCSEWIRTHLGGWIVWILALGKEMDS
jgi:hypothetical protein